jgi:nicotinate-nucleotide--dimethylbenzimidazole phosphoribosyltransferase
MKLQEIIKGIKSPDTSFLKKAEEHTDQLLMPTRAMGRLHRIAERLCSIKQSEKPIIDKKHIIVMAGDHGITEEGVSAYPAEITGMMVNTFLNGGATINVIARQLGAEITVVDMGIQADIPEADNFIVRKIAPGTANFAHQPAMTLEQAEQALVAGFEVVSGVIEQGADIVGTGDMGIGNTTPSTAIGSVITGKPVKEMTGRGTGVDDEGLKRKTEAIQKGIEKNDPDPSDGLDVLSKIGGFEIGGIAGVCLGCAFHKVPVVIDGLISTAGALIAHALAPVSKEYMFAGHCSFEQGHMPMLQSLELEPVLDLGMRLGEGTGGGLAMHIMQAAVNIHNQVLTFKDIGLEKGK